MNINKYIQISVLLIFSTQLVKCQINNEKKISSNNSINQDHPGARDHVAFAYYFKNNNIILYGGSGISEGNYNWNADTWELNGHVWKNINNNIPGKITSMSTVSIKHNNTILMVGGVNPDKGDLNETWIFENNNWELHKGNNPSARLSPAMAYNPLQKVVVLFSGCVGRDYPSDTWEWVGNDWVQKSVEGPNGLCRSTLFYDAIRKKIVLFGGVTVDDKKVNEMWEWDGSIWKAVNQGNIIPEGRSNSIIAYDESRNRAILYGGSGKSGVLDDLWEWDGSQWHEIKVIDERPKKTEVYGMTYHNKQKKIFMYGGRSAFAKPNAELWSWDGIKWKKH